jgi:hypothetical protein
MQADDDDFCTYYEFIEQFAERVARDESQVDMLLKLIEVYKTKGVFDLSQLVIDEVISVGKEDGKTIEVSSFHELKSDTLLVGQIDKSGKLQGIGRKVTPLAVIEGEFKDNIL